jgi:hypothetical protein
MASHVGKAMINRRHLLVATPLLLAPTLTRAVTTDFGDASAAGPKSFSRSFLLNNQGKRDFLSAAACRHAGTSWAQAVSSSRD